MNCVISEFKMYISDNNTDSVSNKQRPTLISELTICNMLENVTRRTLSLIRFNNRCVPVTAQFTTISKCKFTRCFTASVNLWTQRLFCWINLLSVYVEFIQPTTRLWLAAEAGDEVVDRDDKQPPVSALNASQMLIFDGDYNSVPQEPFVCDISRFSPI